MKQKLILVIVDDSPIIIDRLVPALEELSRVKNIMVGDTYEEGKNLIDKNDFDVAILDINLPGKSGIELLKHLKRKYPDKYVIMMTDDPSEEKMAACRVLGANYFINKFSDFEDIPDIIQNL